MKRVQMTISFGEFDDDVYNFLQSQKNASALVRRLVRGYMGGNVVQPTHSQTIDNPAPPQIQEKQVEKIIEKPSIEAHKIEKNRAQMPDL